GDRGEGAIVGAGAISIAGAALLGPVGLVSGVFIRGNSIKIPAGSVTFVQTSGDIVVSAYPIPSSIQVTEPSITTSQPQQNTSQGTYNPDRDTIIKGDVFNRNAYGANTPTGGDFELPPEQNVN
ncbi:MAG: hypothetical protein IJS42_06215, partial [Synergistaceae bacterium]|nr:hypothetical protein [Synergistaceae bacterium]